VSAWEIPIPTFQDYKAYVMDNPHQAEYIDFVKLFMKSAERE
jgi:hypothetical protein